ncbi:hypothetical protein C5E45_32785 [Nocardia nova]|uniref:HTH cro/C1-type domain-containing protein n=1 Tax=Nocardia nova TaxID=37330 RepID=A0A2S6ACP8_9NOCA|nr:helix-turn-helix transcriptional regulator [Nocardia nova]PPJ31868.1 hypothetical protein C5E45_32785 [Nocardia nova]
MSKASRGPAGPFALATADEIAAELRRRRLDQKDLAEMSDIKTSYLSTRMRGELPLDLNDVDAICVALGLSRLELFERAEALMKSRGGDSAYSERITGRGSVTGPASDEKVAQLKQATRARSK